MKKSIVIFAVISLLSVNLFSQEIPRMRPKDRFIVGTFTDIWSDLPGNMETRTINRGVSIDYLQDFPISTSNFSFAVGLGFVSHNLYGDYFYERTIGRHDFVPNVLDLDYDNNKLSLNYLNIPVEFRYRSRNTPQTIRVHAGVKAGVLLKAHTKYVGELLPGGRDTHIKEAKLDNIETFMFGVHGRIGYGRFNLNTFFNLTNIFEGNNAENASFMSIGLSFIVF
ncbi:MAG: PorT family protein [Bacteroidetes bacterium]|nr:MAG: PorT family protein [Bacteroidota bacterium]